MEKKVKTGIECPECKERMFSWHRHDFHFCEGGHVFIDGGDDYLRYSGSATKGMPKTIKFDPKKDKVPDYAKSIQQTKEWLS